MLWLHRTALFQAACRIGRKPGFRRKELPWPWKWDGSKLKPEGVWGVGVTLQGGFHEERIPLEGSWGHQVPGDKVLKFQGPCEGHDSPLSADEVSCELGKEGARWG